MIVEYTHTFGHVLYFIVPNWKLSNYMVKIIRFVMNFNDSIKKSFKESIIPCYMSLHTLGCCDPGKVK